MALFIVKSNSAELALMMKHNQQAKRQFHTPGSQEAQLPLCPFPGPPSCAHTDSDPVSPSSDHSPTHSQHRDGMNAADRQFNVCVVVCNDK